MSDADQQAMLSLIVYDEMLCSGCHQPRSKTLAPAGFAVGKFTCWGCATLAHERRQDQKQSGPDWAGDGVHHFIESGPYPYTGGPQRAFDVAEGGGDDGDE